MSTRFVVCSESFVLHKTCAAHRVQPNYARKQSTRDRCGAALHFMPINDRRNAASHERNRDTRVFPQVLLSDEQGRVFEGLSSNFAAVIDGAVHTAGEGILLGTVRQVVLDVCEQQGIPVVLQPPSIQASVSAAHHNLALSDV